MDNEVSDLRRRASVSLFQTAGWLHAHLDDKLQPLGLSAQQLKVLSILHRQPSQQSTVSLIRDEMTDPNSNVSRLLNKLMEKGFVEKRRSSEDQRVVHIRLTAKGREVMCAGRDALDDGESILCRLSQAELGSLVRLLQKLRTPA